MSIGNKPLLEGRERTVNGREYLMQEVKFKLTQIENCEERENGMISYMKDPRIKSEVMLHIHWEKWKKYS